MLSREFRFHICKAAIAIIDMISGSPLGYTKKFMSFRQYITNMAIIVFGSTLDKYCIYFGVFLFSGNNIKGIDRSSQVTRAIIPNIIIDSVTVKGMFVAPF